MYNRTGVNKKITQSMFEEEESVFKEKKSKPVQRVIEKQKEPLPKFSPHKRQKKEIAEIGFYGVMFLISLVSLGINFYLARLGASVSSFLAAIFSFFCLFYTEPYKWQEENKQLAFWNVSVTMSVLIKSIHLKLFQWRNILMWALATGLTLSYFVSPSMVGVFGGLYLILVLLFLAERNLKLYAKVSLGLAWISVAALFFSLIFTKCIPLGTISVALLLYQIHERVKGLEVEEPYEEIVEK